MGCRSSYSKIILWLYVAPTVTLLSQTLIFKIAVIKTTSLEVQPVEDNIQICTRCKVGLFVIEKVINRKLKASVPFKWQNMEMVSEITITEGGEIPNPPKVEYEDHEEYEARCAMCGNRCWIFKEVFK